MSRSSQGIRDFGDLNAETGLDFIRPKIENLLNQEA